MAADIDVFELESAGEIRESENRVTLGGGGCGCVSATEKISFDPQRKFRKCCTHEASSGETAIIADNLSGWSQSKLTPLISLSDQIVTIIVSQTKESISDQFGEDPVIKYDKTSEYEPVSPVNMENTLQMKASTSADEHLRVQRAKHILSFLIGDFIPHPLQLWRSQPSPPPALRWVHRLCGGAAVMPDQCSSGEPTLWGFSLPKMLGSISGQKVVQQTAGSSEKPAARGTVMKRRRRKRAET